MKIAIDISPLSDLNQVRGVGVYTKNLIESLNKVDKKNEYLYFIKGEKIPQADLIHYPYFDLFFHTLPVFKKAKTIVTIHDLTPLVFSEYYQSGIKGWLKFQLQKLALRDVSTIITVSNNSKNDIKKYLNIKQSKIQVIYSAAQEGYGIIRNKKKLIRIQRQYNLPDKFLLYVGDVDFNKNLSKLMEAIAKIKVPLVMIGQAIAENNLPQTKILLNKISSLGLEKYILRPGFLPKEDLVGIYNLAYAYILPSLYEGFGLTVLEAMSCGCPVICSQTSSLPEVGGEAALYIDPCSSESMVKTISTLLKLSTTEYKKLQKKSLLHAAKFSWEKTARETIDIYEKICR